MDVELVQHLKNPLPRGGVPPQLKGFLRGVIFDRELSKTAGNCLGLSGTCDFRLETVITPSQADIDLALGMNFACVDTLGATSPAELYILMKGAKSHTIREVSSNS